MSGHHLGFLYWVIPGVLAGMPMPFLAPARRLQQGGALNEFDDDLGLIHGAGVRAVVSLVNDPSAVHVFRAAGFDFCCIPIPDGHPPALEQALEFVRFVRQSRADRKPVAAHCHAGLGRTGTMLAAYLVAEGATATEAIWQVRDVERGAIETTRQVQFLEAFEPHCRKHRV
jgi:hypothetical protein